MDTPSIVVVVARVLANLLGVGRASEVIPAEMGRLGQALDVDRVYIFENEVDPDSGLLTCSQRFEWARDAISAEIDNPELQGLSYAEVLPRWEQELGSGRPLHGVVATFPPAERPILEEQAIQSLLVVPVTVDGVFWGFMGFDDCRSPRAWRTDEIQILSAAAAAFGTSLRARRAESALRLSAAAFANTRDGVAIVDGKWRIVQCNDALVQAAGRTEAALRNQPLDALLADPAAHRAMVRAMDRLGYWRGEVPQRTASGQTDCLLGVSRVDGRGDTQTHYVAVFTDISRLKATQQRLAHLGLHDALTDLPNRHQLEAHLHEALARAEASGDRVGLLFLDLDHFKTVNDSLGHLLGDELLVAVASRLRRRLRRGDLVARLGGDEFLVVLEGMRDADDALRLADVLLKTIRTPYELSNGREVYSTASVGVAVFPDDGRSPLDLIQFADAAMYTAKGAGRGVARRYEAAMTLAAQARLSLETRLRRAVEGGEIEAWFQPQYDTATGAVVGVEALARWPQPDGGFISPGRFIPLAEESNLIEALTVQSIAAASRLWPRLRDALGYAVPVAVNLSPALLRRADAVHLISEALKAHPIPAGGLELELTESALMMKPARVVRLLQSLRALGTVLAIDDFGTGYSNIGALRTYPLDRLKIDRSFIDDVPTDPGANAIAQTVIDLARNLGLRTVAEGVEHEPQRRFLVEHGADAWQGYLGAKAMPPDVLIEALRSGG